MCAVGAPCHAAAQEQPEPVLDQLRATFAQPGLTFGLLLQSVLDPGVDGEPASARVPEARLLVSGRLDGGFNYLLQTNFAAAPSVLDARVGWSRVPSFAIDAGRFKTPFSRELLTFAGELDFVTRSRVVSSLAPNRQLGAQLSGALDEHLSWAVGGFTGNSNATPNESLAGVVRIRGSGIEVADGMLELAGHVAVGQDGAVGTRIYGSDFVGDGILLGVDGRFESGPLLLSGEYIRSEWDLPGPVETDADGLYLTAGWTFVQDRQLLLRWDRIRGLTGAADDVLVLGFNTWPTSVSKIQVNWLVPLRGSAEPYRILGALQLSF